MNQPSQTIAVSFWVSQCKLCKECKENEDYARRLYIQEMSKKGTHFILHKVGLIISSSKPHLACSPDNFLDDGSADDISGSEENKCPYAAQ